MPTLDGPLHIKGDLSSDTMTIPASAVTNDSVSGSAAIVRSKLAQEALKSYPIDLTNLRIWDAYQTNLPGTASADDLALDGGTFGTAPPTVKTSDLKAAGATIMYARFQVTLPAEYDDAETVIIRFSAGMLTTIADTSTTIDIQAHESDRAGGIGSDLVTTSSETMNSLTFANKDFTITASGLVSGDILDVRVAIVVTDAATGTAVIGAIGSVELLCDVRG